MEPAADEIIPVGTQVVAIDGEVIGRVEAAYPHYLLVKREGMHGELNVPTHAIERFDGQRLYLTVNPEALSPVDDEESAKRRLGEAT